jgi:putative flavoprotein involved in K+ transport
MVATEPGLYFAGLIFQYSLTSDVLPNGGRDAEYVARHIARSTRRSRRCSRSAPRSGA